MADGFARASGRIAAVSTTSGPAVANIACAMGQGTTDTSPILVIASTPRSELVGRNRGGLHDLNDSLEIARAVCRYHEHCSSPDQVSQMLAGLISKLREGRPGTAYLQIPSDVMGAPFNGEICTLDKPARLAPEPTGIAQAVELLKRSKRPLIVAGTGCVISEAGEEIRQLAERLGAVVSTTVLGRGIIPGDHPNVIHIDGASLTAVGEIFRKADVVLAIGTMFKEEDTCGWQIEMGEQLIHVDIDPEEFGRSYKAEVYIRADARAACEAINAALPSIEPADSAWAAEAKAKQEESVESRRSSQGRDLQFAESFRKILPREALFFTDRCNIGYWFFRCLPSYRERSFHYPMGYGGLGGTLPQAIGAKIARPDARVVALLGDGGMQFSMTDLAVAVQESLKLTIIVSNNHSYGAIKAGLGRNYPGVSLGTDLSGPDYEYIAKAYGIPYIKVCEREGFLKAFADEVENDRLVMIEFDNDIADP